LGALATAVAAPIAAVICLMAHGGCCSGVKSEAAGVMGRVLLAPALPLLATLGRGSELLTLGAVGLAWGSLPLGIWIFLRACRR
jgi:hypothetical protein